MKIAIYQRKTSFNAVNFDKIEIECRGTGFALDPIIIEPSETLSDSFYIKANYLHILIRNCTKSFISLEASSNVTLEDCELGSCHIIGCSNIKINNSTISDTLDLYETSFSFIENSSIYYLKLNQSNGNTIRNCNILNLNNKYSENDFEGNTIPEKQLSKLTKRPLMDFIEEWRLQYLFIISVLIYTILLLLLAMLPFNIPIPLVIILFFISIIIYYVPILVKIFIKRQKIGTSE